MAGALGPLAELGREVARSLGEAAPARARSLDEARRAFLRSALEERTPRSSGALRPVWVLGLASALLVSGAYWMHERHRPLTFDIDGAPGVASNWLSAPATAPLRLRFSEGTNVRLEADSRLRVAELGERGASLSLERGHLHADVTHRADSAWKVVAGPFTVAITGTVFDVNWDPSSEQLSVGVAQGSVVVRSAGGERIVRAPETWQATAPGHGSSSKTALTSGEPDAASTAPPEPPATAPNALSKDERVESPWRALARRGALREAFASADSSGFSAACAGASPAELLQLGDGARLSGKAERASEALLTLRRRFPSDPRRAAAAFALGKVGFDQRHAYEQAAEWFATALREQPGGPLAREAAGRLIEALRGADDSAGARRAARDYLTRYPEGPHADLARSVLH